MPEGYSAGSAFLEIVPSFRGIASRINAEAVKWGRSAGDAFAKTFDRVVSRDTSKVDVGPSEAKSVKEGADSGGAFGRAFKAKVEAALASLPDADIDADASGANEQINGIRARLRELSNARIGVDISDEDAVAELDAIKLELDELGAKSPSIQVRVDAATAATKLAALKTEVSSLDGETINIRTRVSGLAGASSGVSGLALAVAGLLPMLGPLAGGLAAAGAGGVAAIGAAGAGAGVAALGLSGVPKAMDLLDKQKQARKSGDSEALASINSQLAQVNPATLKFAKSLKQQVVPALDQVKAVAAVGLLPGIAEGLQKLLKHLPGLEHFVAVVSKKVGELFSQFADALDSPVFQRFFDYIQRSAGPVLDQFFDIVTNLAGAFASFMTAMAPVTRAIGDVLGDWTSKLASTDAFQRFSDWLMDNGPAIKDFFVNVSRMIGSLVKDFAPLGVILMKAIGWFADLVASLPPDVVLAIAAAVGAFVLALKGLAIAAALATGMNPLILAIGLIAAALGAAAVLIISHWDDIVHAFKVAWHWVKSVFVAGWKAAVHGVSAAFEAVAKALSATWDGIKRAASVVWAGIKLLIVNPIKEAASVLSTVVDGVGRVLSGAWNGIKSAASTAWGLIHDYIVKPLQTAYNWVKDTFSSIGSAVSDAFGSIVDFIKAPINAVIRSINWVIRQLNKISFTVPSWVPGIGGDHFGISLGQIPLLADGTRFFAGGLAVVGDRGPELVDLPTGSRVVSAVDTRDVLSGGRTVSVVVELDGRVIGRAVAPVIADEVIVQAGATR